MTAIDHAVVPEIQPQMAWLSWVGAATMCLNALGVDCDQADVAGFSGYAFCLSVNKGLCPSGPTSLDWGALSGGIHLLGRSTLTFASGDCHSGDTRCERTRAHCRAAFEMVRAEVERGRPCVLWGAGVPEFGVVRGVDGEDYVCVRCGPTPERLRFDAVDAPGGPYAMAFPSTTRPPARRDRAAVAGAVAMLSRLSPAPDERCQFDAYDSWIAQLRAGRANAFGNSYNAQCFAEARRHAAAFVDRLSGRNPPVADLLRQAHGALAETAEHMARLAELFPFTHAPGEVSDPGAVGLAVEHLSAARQSEARALRSLRAALESWA